MKSAPEGIEIYPIFVSDQSRQYMRTLISILWISFFPLAAAAQDDDLSYRLKKVIKDKKAEIGIAVILDAQDTVTVNNDDRYPLMSVFKFHQALAVADYLDRNGLTPDTEIFIPEEELVPDTYSPLRDEFPEGGIPISFRSLLEYSMQLSDNNACDILFKHTGGPAATDRYVRSLGLRNFAIAATEQQMHDDPQTCYENWSTPLEAAALLELLVTEQILTPTLREMIRQNLINCKTGADRLPKPLSGTGAVIGHKTGTSDRDERGIFAGTNDPGFVILPDGTRYTIAVFIKDSAENPETNARIIADISETIDTFTTNTGKTTSALEKTRRSRSRNWIRIRLFLLNLERKQRNLHCSCTESEKLQYPKHEKIAAYLIPVLACFAVGISASFSRLRPSPNGIRR